jgi:bifunctional DNA-binding transcriptional regulator/antitoxin component of YhaV-PrlF toxin-antitoxin module
MRVTSKDQVTVPAKKRDELDSGAGSESGFAEEGGQTVLVTEHVEKDESPGARIARKLIELGEKARREGWASDTTSDQFLRETRGPFDDVDPR